MAAGNFTADVITTPSLTVNQFFTTPPPTPGNVGVCLSGGGSRALVAGMGQLQALAYLTANGAPLLGQVKALSTVSGGSWLGVPFEDLRQSGPSDAAYLGTFNPDQGSLTPDQLALLPAGHAGVPITSDLFKPESAGAPSTPVVRIPRRAIVDVVADRHRTRHPQDPWPVFPEREVRADRPVLVQPAVACRPP